MQTQQGLQEENSRGWAATGHGSWHHEKSSNVLWKQIGTPPQALGWLAACWHEVTVEFWFSTWISELL